MFDYEAYWTAVWAREDYLCTHAPRCLKCDTEQVQILDRNAPAKWKCRECKTKFTFEPNVAATDDGK